MQVDYSKDWNLIIPSVSIPSSSIIREEDEERVVELMAHIYVASPELDYDISTLPSKSWNSIIYPTTREPNVYLMYKRCEATLKPAKLPTVAEMADFYENFTPWHSQEKYLERLRLKGEKTFAIYDEDELVSLAYTTKGCNQLNSFFTREDFRNKGYGTRLLEMAGHIHLFVEDESLLSFYQKRGFEIKRTYRRQRCDQALK